jgi:protein-tyrosine phosphatase
MARRHGRSDPGRRGLAALLVLAGAALADCTRPALPPEAGPPRHIALHGTLNTRDLGGYLTQDGRRVRWGLLFRSDRLSELNDGDVDTLASLGLRRVYDLRSENERMDHEDRLPEGVAAIALPVSDPALDPDRLRSLILGGGAEEGEFHDLLVRANRSFAVDYRAEFGALIAGLAQPGGLPALFHCSYGKDRTGFAAAVILEILGVPWETTVGDYLLSNVTLAPEIERKSRLIWVGSLFRISRDNARDLLVVKREYLEAARQAAVERFGSTDAYVREGLGITNETRERLRQALLE